MGATGELYDGEEYKNKNVLVTGGLGFIGSNLVHTLVELGSNVTVLDALHPSCGGNLFNVEDVRDKIEVELSDVRDVKSTENLVKDKEFIFNLVGHVSHTESMQDPLLDLEINCRTHLTLLDAVRKNNPDARMIYAGTRGQYGRAKNIPVNEDCPINPIDVNGINKHAGEQYHVLYNRVYGLKTTSLRLTNTYGPRHQMKHSRQGIVNWFIRLSMDDEKIKIFGNGKQVRDCNYVDDVVSVMLISMVEDKAVGEVFNLGGTPISLADLVKKIIDATGCGSYEFADYPLDSKRIEIGDYIADYRKIKNTLGFVPETSLEEGLRKTISFYKKNKSKYW